MKHMTSNKERKIDAYKRLYEIIPRDLIQIILELEDNPLWLEIGNYLKSIPVRENVGRLRLIDELSARTREDYYKIRDALENLEDKGYIFVKRASKPDHFLTPPFAEAIKIRNRLEVEVLNPILDELKSDPEFSGCKNLDESIRRAIFSALQ